MSIEIRPLEARHVETLAAWHQAEWRHLSAGLGLEARCDALLRHCDSTDLPATFIALDGDTLAGSVCLVAHDIADRPGYLPWLSRVYVAPAHRGRGIGERLIDHAVRWTRERGHRALYLITEDRGGYYARMGWRKVEDYRLNGHPVEIMSRPLR